MFDNILVPLDGSELSERALPTAQNLAEKFGATIHLIHVITRENEYSAARGAESILVSEMEIDTVRRLNEDRLVRGRKYVDQIGSQLSSAGAKVESQDAIKEGDASQNIVDHVKDHQIDLVVMSTHGHGGVRRLLMGSVTDRVIRSCEAPVLVVPCS